MQTSTRSVYATKMDYINLLMILDEIIQASIGVVSRDFNLCRIFCLRISDISTLISQNYIPVLYDPCCWDPLEGSGAVGGSRDPGIPHVGS